MLELLSVNALSRFFFPLLAVIVQYFVSSLVFESGGQKVLRSSLSNWSCESSVWWAILAFLTLVQPRNIFQLVFP